MEMGLGFDSDHGEFEQEGELVEFEKEICDSKVRKSEGPKLFQRLQEYILRAVREANRRAGKSEYRVVRLRPRLFDLCRDQRIRVDRCDGKTPPLTITYSVLIQHFYFECGATKRRYRLVVDEDGNLWFATSCHIRKTIEEVATEMLKEIQTDNPATAG